MPHGKKTVEGIGTLRRLYVAGLPVAAIARRMSLHPGTIRAWVKQAEDAGEGWSKARRIHQRSVFLQLHDALVLAKDRLLAAQPKGELPSCAATLKQIDSLLSAAEQAGDPRRQAETLRGLRRFTESRCDEDTQEALRSALERYARTGLRDFLAEWLHDEIFRPENHDAPIPA